jgi:hypothetical protein
MVFVSLSFQASWKKKRCKVPWYPQSTKIYKATKKSCTPVMNNTNKPKRKKKKKKKRETKCMLVIKESSIYSNLEQDLETGMKQQGCLPWACLDPSHCQCFSTLKSCEEQRSCIQAPSSKLIKRCFYNP